MSTTDQVMIAARRALLDALDALHAHRAALVLVGAQAIYLRTNDAAASFTATYTTDGDLVVDPGALADRPDLARIMEDAGFTLRYKERPGIWGKNMMIAEASETVTVDLLVPEALGGPGSRSAQLAGHAKISATRAVGLEAAIIDNSPMTIAALDPDDHRSVTLKVAGPVALLVAKLHKLYERVASESARPDRVRGKDAADIYRLIEHLDARSAVTIGTLHTLLADGLAGGVTATALNYLNELFTSRSPGLRSTTPRSPGRERTGHGRGLGLASAALAGDLPAERITAVCNHFTTTIQEQLADR